ncbi:MAG: GTP-binding protein [Clostridiales bacterium]|nr:GTP-binding protein [Candidatus Crickella merdequi]
MTKVDIFSGFLGAGKTTLIKKLVAEAYGDEKIVLIENEFGEIGVDSGFLKNTGIEINEMNAGCICCTLVGDFAKALDEVIEKYSPDRILIEPSGVGKLSDVIIAVQDLNNENIELNSFTTVVDAKRCKAMMRSFGEFYENQVEHASSIILSHQAGLSEEKLAEVINMIKELNPTASIVTTDWPDLHGSKILKVMEDNKTLSAELEHLREEAHHELEEHEHHHHEDGEECCCGHHHDHDHEEHEHHHHHHHEDGEECCCGHHHDHEEHEHHHHHHHHEHGEGCSCGCGHDHHHADEVFEEMAQHTANKYSEEELEEILDTLDECGEVLRAKGIVENKNGGWLEFDYVPGEGEVRTGEAEATGTVIVIGTNLKKDKLKALFAL